MSAAAPGRTGRSRLVFWVTDHRVAIMLACLAVCIYAPGIGWGIPGGAWPPTYVWGSDDQVPIQGIQELHHTVTGSPGHDLHYPMFHYLLLAIVYAPYLLLLKLSGGWPHGFGEFSPASLRTLTYLGRSLSVLMMAGTVIAALDIGNTLWGRRYRMLAAAFVGLIYPAVYYSRTGNLDGPGLFWTSAGLAVYARMLKDGITLRRCFWLAAFAAAAAGTKDAYYAFFLGMPLFLAAIHHTSPDQKGHRLPWKPMAVLAGSGIAVYAFTSGFILGPHRFVDHINYISGRSLHSPVYFGQPNTVAGYIALGKEFLDALAASIGAPMAAACAAGLYLLPRRQKWLLLAPALVYIALIVVMVRQAQIRFMLPVSLTAALFAAYACGRALEFTGWRRLAGALAVSLCCVVLLLQDVELTYEMFFDSRHAVARWIDQHHSAGDTIGYFGPPAKLPRPSTKVRFELVVPWFGTVMKVHYTPDQVANMAEMVRNTKAGTVLLVQDNWEPEHPYGNTCPTGLYEQLSNGSLGFHLAAQFQTPPLIPGIARARLDYPGPNPRADVFVRDRKMR